MDDRISLYIKRIIKALFFVGIILLISGCNKNEQDTFVLENVNGENIQLKFLSDLKFEVNEESEFFVEDGNKKIFKGTLLPITQFNEYRNMIDLFKYEADYIVRKDVEYFVISDAKKKLYYFMKITESNSGVLLISEVSRERSEEILEKIVFKNMSLN